MVTYAAGHILTAADVNALTQAAVTFPLGTAAWTSYTPTLTQSATVTKTVTWAKYNRIGRIIHFNVQLQCTGAGTAANVVLLGLPVAAAATAQTVIGAAAMFDASAGIFYGGTLVLNDTVTSKFFSTGNGNYVGVSGFSAALASSDYISYSGTYESAT